MMTPEEARELLYDAPKEQVMEAGLFDAAFRLAERGEFGMRVNEFGEIVVGGGLTVDGDTAPTIRYSRAAA